MIDPVIGRNLSVELTHGDSSRIANLGFSDLSALKRVVEDDETARSDEPQRALVVAVVFGLVGVDKHEVEWLAPLSLQARK
jgi:hypothetical protein